MRSSFFSPVKAIAVAATLVMVALAGCINASDDPTPASNTGPAGAGTLRTELPEDLLTGDKAHDYLLNFIMKTPLRSASFAGWKQAQDYLLTSMGEMGLATESHAYSSTGVNIIGYHNGTTNPNEWIVLTAHYDTASETGNVPLHTIYGAWDDGAGTAALLELARSLSQREFNRTIVFLFTDEEEQGLLGSQAFVKDYATREDIKILANINMDPPALNYPCQDPDGAYLPVTILYDDSAENQMLLYNASVQAADVVGVPEEARDFHTGGVPIAEVAGTGLSGSSDHVSFQAAGIPAIFLGGAVGKKVAIVSALSYGLHTAADTAQQMEVRCGGADLLKAGFQTILDMAYHTLTTIDGYPTADFLPAEGEAEAAAMKAKTPVAGNVYFVGSSLKPAPGTDMEAYERIMALRAAGALELPALG